MLPAFVIDEIRKREQRKKIDQQEQPSLPIPGPFQEPEPIKSPKDEPERGVIILELV